MNQIAIETAIETAVNEYMEMIGDSDIACQYNHKTWIVEADDLMRENIYGNEAIDPNLCDYWEFLSERLQEFICDKVWTDI